MERLYMMKQEKFQEELLIEFNELKERLDSLNANLKTKGYREKVGDYQFKLIKKQALGMDMYYNALSERLKDLNII